ncbi:uncharacterized protein LOC110747717, partial [Prunus avium]|uniref:Uncharacterized protein LOC110747717 n=1 Tax=Prunus avium TaxID=42229 RepID=A0A6P5RR62_PRUAV
HTLMKRIFKPPQLVELKRLDLSGNGIVSLPESISQLSKLRELGLFRCSNLQSLPKQLPLSIKFIDVRHCPMLPISRNLTVWTAINGFSFMICENSDEDEDRTRHQLAVREELHDELFFSKYIEDRIYHEKPFEIRAHFPDSTRVPNWCRHWMSGSSVIAKLPIDTEGSNGRCMGFALFVAFEIVENENFQKSWELEKTVCHFSTREGRLEHPIVFQNFENYRVGSSYGLC